MSLEVFPQVALNYPDINADIFNPQRCPEINDFAQLFSSTPFTFTPQEDDALKECGGYERYIEEYHSIPTRPRHWHDYYNALSWKLFPKCKMKLHESQIQYSRNSSANNRSPQQNGATLFDENGVIIVSSQSWVFEELRQHNWQNIFLKRRKELMMVSKIFILGHAIWEKFRSPYLGLTAKWLSVQVPEKDLHTNLSHLRQIIDIKICKQIPLLPSDLKPLPLLGWPNICSENSNPQFYDNKNYFRPLRKAIP